jgi:hypothetical protein
MIAKAGPQLIFINVHSRFAFSRIPAFLAHEGEHLVDRDFSVPFARERRAFNVQYGLGRSAGIPEQFIPDRDIHNKYGL